MKEVAIVVALGSAACAADPVVETLSSSEAAETTCDFTRDCGFVFIGGYVDPLQLQLGCGQTYLFGFWGSPAFDVAFCPDSNAMRARLSALRRPFYLPGYCTRCLSVPLDQLLVVWREETGPGCPSGCIPE